MPPRREGGFTYLGLLFAVALMGFGIAAASQVWHTASKREKEKELLFIGHQFRDAIGRYYERSPAVKQYPARLEDLVEDKRFPMPQRHLRKLYRDPMTGSAEWGVIVEQGRIVGVHSRSDQAPAKVDGFAPEDAEFREVGRYAEWKFIYRPGMKRSAAAPAAAGPTIAGEAPGALPAATPTIPKTELDRLTICLRNYMIEVQRCTQLPEEDRGACILTAGGRRADCEKT